MHSPLVIYLHRYPPDYEALQFAGMRRLLDQLLIKFDVLYLSLRGVWPPNPELRRGLRIHQLRPRVNPFSGMSKLFKTLLFYLYLPVIIRILRRERPALIICKEPLPLVPILLARCGVPVLIGGVSDFWWRIFLGGNWLGDRLAGFLERLEAKQWRRLGVGVIANTKAEAELVGARGMDPARIFQVNTTSVQGVFFPCAAGFERRQLGFQESDWVVAIHGTIRPGKGYRQLLHWWRELIKQHPHWHLLIIGGAGGEAWCRRQIRRLGLEGHAHMTGWLPTQAEVNRHLNAADCLLVMRRNSDDNRGIIPSALYHSLATAKPTVATGLAGMAEIIRHGVDGFLFAPEDFESFHLVLEFIAGHLAEAARRGQAGMVREKECFDPETSAQATVAVVEQMIMQANHRSTAIGG
ncbi:MAG: glycosyltransferase family 4 protein [Lentisphaerae bacterium]|nr:glycosyltransferase family 4 protein [Lentisphaerota bacterium]